MGTPVIRLGRVARKAALGTLLILACSARGFAQSPSAPIQSPQDAVCRNEARARVFTAPDPQGLGLYAVGRRIYTACMQRTGGSPAKGSPTRRARLRDAAR